MKNDLINLEINIYGTKGYLKLSLVVEFSNIKAIIETRTFCMCYMYIV